MDYYAPVQHNRTMSRSMHVFLHPEVQGLIDAFARSFPAKITLFSASMEELSVALGNPGSPFCRVVREEMGLVGLCKAMDRAMCSRAVGNDGVTRYRCHGGLVEAILPVKIDGRIIGYFMLGQFRDGGPVDDSIWEHARTRGVDVEHIRRSFESVPLFSPEAIGSMMELFAMLVRFIVSQRYVAAPQGILLNRIESWIQDNIHQAFRLDNMARDLAKSPSALSHTVKDKAGMSLGSLVALRKVEAFEEQMRRHPEWGIKEGADWLGYDDPLYFSRVYRKIRGQPPKSFIATVKHAV